MTYIHCCTFSYSCIHTHTHTLHGRRSHRKCSSPEILLVSMIANKKGRPTRSGPGVFFCLPPLCHFFPFSFISNTVRASRHVLLAFRPFWGGREIKVEKLMKRGIDSDLISGKIVLAVVTLDNHRWRQTYQGQIKSKMNLFFLMHLCPVQLNHVGDIACVHTAGWVGQPGVMHLESDIMT